MDCKSEGNVSNASGESVKEEKPKGETFRVHDLRNENGICFFLLPCVDCDGYKANIDHLVLRDFISRCLLERRGRSLVSANTTRRPFPPPCWSLSEHSRHVTKSPGFSAFSLVLFERSLFHRKKKNFEIDRRHRRVFPSVFPLHFGVMKLFSRVDCTKPNSSTTNLPWTES